MLALRRFVSPLLLAAVPHIASSQQYDPALYAALRWRLIGPFRGGRTVAAAGVPGQPSVFYIGVNDGGVWKTTDYGRTWVPIFDDQPTGSIGALAVAPSDPKVLYVGSGRESPCCGPRVRRPGRSAARGPCPPATACTSPRTAAPRGGPSQRAFPALRTGSAGSVSAFRRVSPRGCTRWWGRRRAGDCIGRMTAASAGGSSTPTRACGAAT